MTTPFRKALPDGSAMPIRKRRTDCPSPIVLHAYRPTSNTVECWTTRVGPTYRTSNRESPSCLFHLAIPPSFRAVVTGLAGALQAELAGRLECSFSWASARISSRIVPSGLRSVIRSRRRGSNLWDPAWNCVGEMLNVPAGVAAMGRRPRNQIDVPSGQALSGRRDRAAIASVSLFSQMPRFRL